MWRVVHCRIINWNLPCLLPTSCQWTWTWQNLNPATRNSHSKWHFFKYKIMPEYKKRLQLKIFQSTFRNYLIEKGLWGTQTWLLKYLFENNFPTVVAIKYTTSFTELEISFLGFWIKLESKSHNYTLVFQNFSFGPPLETMKKKLSK